MFPLIVNTYYIKPFMFPLKVNTYYIESLIFPLIVNTYYIEFCMFPLIINTYHKECALITLTSLSTFLLSPWAANSRASSKVAQPVNNLNTEIKDNETNILIE